jgi:Calpain family cysteine protease
VNWTWELVLISDPAGGHAAATGYDAMVHRAGQLADIVGDLRRTPWEGPAAEAFRGYLDDLRRVVVDAQGVAEQCQHATDGAAASLDALRGPAQETADQLNKFQKAVKDMGELDFFESIQVQMLRQQATAALARVRDQRNDVLNQLANALKQQEEALLGLKAPRGPDPSTISDPVQRAAVEGLTKEINATFAAEGDTERAERLADEINGADSDLKKRELLSKAADELSAAELDYLMDHLDTDALKKVLDAHWWPFGDNDDTAAQRELFNKLAGKIDLDTLYGLADQVPNNYWHPNPYQGIPQLGDDLGPFGDNLSWQPLPGAGQPVTPASINPNDIQQRGLGDCHLQATLYSIASQPGGPEMLARNIQLNPNGTYTVTLHKKDGTPVPVVVTPDTPVQRNGTGWTSTYDGNQALWVQLYEKAMSQTNGELSQETPTHDGHGQNHDRGYPGMNGGWPEEDYARITGQQPEVVDSGKVTDEQLHQAEQFNRPITVTVLDDPHYKDSSGTDLHGGHVYALDHVDWSTHPPTAHLRNPWGFDHVTMPLDDLRSRTTYLTVGN